MKRLPKKSLKALRCPRAARGSALAFGLVIMVVVAIMLTSIIGFVVGQTKYSLRIHAREQAFQIAESGIHFYRWYLAHQVDGRTAQQVQDFWTNGNPYGVGAPYEVEYWDPAGSAVGRYRLEVTPPMLGSTVVIVRSTGWTYKYPNDVRILEVRFRRPSWSEHIVLSNAFTRFGAGTETFGKIHSNYGIRFDGIAHNIVTSAVSSYNDPDHTGGNEFGVHTHDSPTDPLPPAAVPSRPDVFQGGRQFPVAVVDFNGVLGDLSYIKNVAQAGTDGSLYFDNAHQGRHIILKTNDTFDIRTVQSFNASTNEIINYSGGWQTYTIPNEGVIFVEGHIWLEGTVTGKRTTIVAANLLSASVKNVYIGKDIRYTNYDCTDILGIIGQKDVEIIKNSENDLWIDGALLAQSGRVGRANYGTSDHKSVITVYGALATNQRYGFAWTNGTLNWGYTTRNLYYDNNLLYCPPPYFPVGTQYEMDLWEEK
ncbi:MAG: pilus assembly PilX N-terminal domain-containing protein [bacterium]|nr:pilus assembly PilX N-terminal domain-containing protein [bacterium]